MFFNLMYFYLFYFLTGNYGKFVMQTNNMLEWISSIHASLLPENVVVWDSLLPIIKAEIRDCISVNVHKIPPEELPKYSNFSSKMSWMCWERMHSGFESLQIAVQMVLNYMCNQYFFEDELCCSNLR